MSTQETEISTKMKEVDIIIDEDDFNEILELEKVLKSVQEQLNKLSGAMYRLSKDQESLFVNEKNLFTNIESKRKELAKIYKLNDKKNWHVDINSRKVVYVEKA